MAVHIHVDTSEVDRSLNRLIAGPDFDDNMRFERILLGQFLGVQSDIHIWTGALFRSGDMESRWEKHEWEGELRWGGPSQPRNVDYIHWEVDKTEGHGVTVFEHITSNHNFLRSLPNSDRAYTDAVLAFLRGAE